MITVAEVVQEVIKAHEEKRDVNLNALKNKVASKYGLSSSPRLVDIIAAVPQDYKKVLVPKLMAKPIRTASGVKRPQIAPFLRFRETFVKDCSGGGDVQTSQVPSYQHDGEYLRVLPWRT